MPNTMSSLRESLERIAGGMQEPGIAVDLSQWQEALGIIAEYLVRPMTFERIEAVEAVLKTYLRELLASPVSGDDARFLARWSRDVGFILKQKSYGVKCATPFGYSIFFQNRGEGFSFQRHVTRKTEVFHILQPLSGALMFLCSSEEWSKHYEPRSFEGWLHGKPLPAMEQFAIKPDAGDVYYVSELGIVHTVLGCVLEEFATVSTDMVDRLHDQNKGRVCGRAAARAEVSDWLRRLSDHRPSVARPERGGAGVPLVPCATGDAQVVTLSSSGTVLAERFMARPGQSIVFGEDNARVRVLFLVGGAGEIELHGPGDARDATVPSLGLEAGNVVVIAPGAGAWFRPARDVSISSHRVEPEAALA